MDSSVTDALIAEAIAKQGGYEEVEQKSLWGDVAGALGKKKSHATMIKQRYEDMLRASVEQDEQEEEEAQDHEVERILDKRTHQGQLEPACWLHTFRAPLWRGPRAQSPRARLALAHAPRRESHHSGTSLNGRDLTRMRTTHHGSRGATWQACGGGRLPRDRLPAVRLRPRAPCS
mgnify:CR=1 FL=1